MADENAKLVRGLTLTDAASLVIGTIIGTGIFLQTTVMTQQVGSAEMRLLVNSLQTSPLEAGTSLLLISLGIPVYFYFRRANFRAEGFVE